MRKVAYGLIGFSYVALAQFGTAWWQPACAQLNGSNTSNPTRPAQKPQQSAPDALPGARADKERVTPAERGIADLKPTDALFDSINRGDITTARDAIGRGADLQGRNLLGMTPLELAVDLGRNDITFLILSYRGIDGALPSRVGPAGREAAAPAPHPSRAEQRRAMAEAAAQARAARLAAQNAQAQAAAPRSYASDGGAPVPSAGFLGFGSH